VKEVQSYLGLVNYFHRQIKNYSDRAYSLTKLLRKDVPFEWGSKQETSFLSLKEALTGPPASALPDFSKEMVLTADASDVSISFNLSQYSEGHERIIELGARGLRPAEKNYSVSEKELLAIIVGVQHYHEYLAGRQFVI